MLEEPIGVYVTQSNQALSKPRSLGAQMRTLARSASLSLLSRLAPLQNGPFLRLIYCHYVFDDQIENFRDVLKTVQKLGTFIDTDTSVSMVLGKRPIDGKYFHLSFDDGFRNIFQNAAPILRELGIPAAIFVPTSLVGADWERCRSFSIGRAKYSGVLEMISWEELRILCSWGFEIGSHTRTHARLSEISRNSCALEEEVIGSKRELEDRLGVECKYISWPFGRRDDIDKASLECVRRAKYVACFAAFRGGIYPDCDNDIFSIPRHHIEVQWPLSHLWYFANGGREK